VVEENAQNVDRLLDLDFGYCKMVVALRDEEPYKTVETCPITSKLSHLFQT
jgi:ATP phosphoribosyltransferase